MYLQLEEASCRAAARTPPRPHTMFSANNYADCLVIVGRLEEARIFLRKVLPVARRVFGENGEITLRMRGSYAAAGTGRSTARSTARVLRTA